MNEETEHNKDDETMAAEFALGLLDGDEQAAAVFRSESDPTFREKVAKWEERFATLLSAMPHVPPPEHLKALIDEQLFGKDEDRDQDPKAAPTHLGPSPAATVWETLAFWRWCSAAFAALAALLIAATFFGDGRRSTDSQVFVAALNPADAAASIVVRIDVRRGEVSIKAFDVDDEGRETELWLIPSGGAPQSLGVFDPSQSAIVGLRPDKRASVQPGASFAISLEPEGGSRTGAPTGPIIAIGGVEPL